MAALSFASDLSLGQPMEHALRTAVLAVHLARQAGLSRLDVRDCYFLALLRSLGCNAEADRVSEVFGDEQAVNAWLTPMINAQPLQTMRAVVTRVGSGQPPVARARAIARTLVGLPGLNSVAPAHCEVARLLAARLGFPAEFQQAINQVFERWDGKGLPHKLRGEKVRRTVRVVAVAREVEFGARAGGLAGAIALVRERSGAALDPQLCEVFLANAAALCAKLDVESVRAAALALEPDAEQQLDDARLDAVLRAFGELADLRSRFTRGHSDAVARLAAGGGAELGLDAGQVQTLRRAGWVHEVGLAAVPVSIVEKPGPLFGQVGGFPDPGPAQNILWALSSMGILIASPMLAIRFAREGRDVVAAGHLLLMAAALMLYAGGPISTPGGQVSFSSAILFYVPALLAIGSSPAHPLFSRICGAITALLFAAHGFRALAGGPVGMQDKVVTAGGYIFMTLAVIGWMVGLIRRGRALPQAIPSA